TAIVSGEQAQNACTTFLSVRRYIEQTQRHAKEGGRALLILKAGADRIRQGFSSFGKIASSFRILAIQARIEAANLSTSQLNLKNLADDVRSCGDGIRERADAVLRAAADFDSRIASTLREVSRFETIQLQV